jgi:hypothetical protein
MSYINAINSLPTNPVANTVIHSGIFGQPNSPPASSPLDTSPPEMIAVTKKDFDELCALCQKMDLGFTELTKEFTKVVKTVKKPLKAARAAERAASGAGKRSPNGYILYCNASREGAKLQYPDETPQNIMRILGAQWKQLSDDERKQFNAEAKTAKDANMSSV